MWATLWQRVHALSAEQHIILPAPPGHVGAGPRPGWQRRVLLLESRDERGDVGRSERVASTSSGVASQRWAATATPATATCGTTAAITSKCLPIATTDFAAVYSSAV